MIAGKEINFILRERLSWFMLVIASLKSEMDMQARRGSAYENRTVI